ncbi:lachesin [Eurytemora carolleeae]|uniref:lachesin n=1 Tax=Eurytemora carolleeae TaxID=1294199 RepID=UPI000C76210F|nr:lachesin [Eurytemora carolleeae]|eukprot:XP_023329676.1 lachesin-like [Eurytemora affinis]
MFSKTRIFLVFFSVAGSVVEIQDTPGPEQSSTHGSVPTLEKTRIVPDLSPDVIAMTGSDIRLVCHVQNINNYTVSWIRHSDTDLLTVGLYTYTPDTRFSAIHPVLQPLYQLRIAGVHKSDEGIYECQISTTPPIGHFVKLSIVDPVTEILGGPDIFVDAGSTINLTCVASFTPGPPQYVKWLHFTQEISWMGLYPGNYTCAPQNSRTASVHLHVLQGKHPAAIQGSPVSNHPSILLHIIVIILSTIQSLHFYPFQFYIPT